MGLGSIPFKLRTVTLIRFVAPLPRLKNYKVDVEPKFTMTDGYRSEVDPSSLTIKGHLDDFHLEKVNENLRCGIIYSHRAPGQMHKLPTITLPSQSRRLRGNLEYSCECLSIKLCNTRAVSRMPAKS